MVGCGECVVVEPAHDCVHPGVDLIDPREMRLDDRPAGDVTHPNLFREFQRRKLPECAHAPHHGAPMARVDNPSSRSAVRVWVAGARPRTLPAAVVPVIVGVGAATGLTADGVVWWRAAAALLVSLSLQVAVNYANDYSDGVRGTDDVRVGPLRLVGSGVVAPRSVKLAAFACFGFAAVIGLALAVATTWWLLAVGAAAIAAGWFYTGGPRPYGYLGLGELFVFVFFGVVATVGTTYVAVETTSATAWIASIGVGCLACALLVINNLRDIPTDAASGKRTLAVRLGDARTRRLYIALIVLAFVVVVVVAFDRWQVVIALLAAGLAIPAVASVRRGARGLGLVAVLTQTGRLQLAYGVLFSIGLVSGS